MAPNNQHNPSREFQRPRLSREEYFQTRGGVPSRRPSVDGITSSVSRSNSLLPANQDEYLDALANRVPRRDVRSDVNGMADPGNIFGVSVEEFISKAGRLVRHLRHFKKWLPAFGVLAVLVFSVLSIANWQSDTRATANYKAAQEVDNGDTPGESPPYNGINYQVADDQPKYLRINKLGVDTRVVRLGVRTNSEPRYPTNIYDVGWYENSAAPAENGTGLLIGHISGDTKNGVFYDLTSLVPGDRVEIEDGKGRLYQYYVVKSVVYDRNNVDFGEALKSVDAEKPGLNLMTAIGSFSKNADQTQQLVVYTVQDGVVLPGPGLIN